MSENQQNEGLNIELNELVAQGVYATGAIINHSPSEFVVDFVQFLPGARPSVKSARPPRRHAKRWPIQG